MTDLRWTKDKPTVEGWYWVKEERSGESTMVLIDEHDLACANDEFCPHCKARAYSSLHYPGLWAGPIPEPEEAED